MSELIARDPASWPPLDLRDVEHRTVHRLDAVIITGAEYLRKSRLASEVESAEALRAEWCERARRELLAEIDAWLHDEAADADGAEWDADFYRVVRARLAEHFKP